MKILLFGKNGQLGRELQRTLMPLGVMTALDNQELNLCDLPRLEQSIAEIRPHVIINAAAYTAVDRAEQEYDLAMQVNAHAVDVMARSAEQIRAAFLHFSTDYVFDGTKGSPYTESDTPSPLNVYGQSKLAGEQAVERSGGAFAVFRTSWVYSISHDGFLTKVLNWSRKNPQLQIVEDQVGSPTWARLLAEVTTCLLARAGHDFYDYFATRRGIYHLAGKGAVSRLDWARAILALDSKPHEQVCTSIQPARTDDFPTPARRPLYSALDCSRFEQAFDLTIPDWSHSLRLAMEV